ncbi:uvrC [Symbiodinium microadriaticum]|nr:uvrC [Symbiodinium microadriaticum]
MSSKSSDSSEAASEMTTPPPSDERGMAVIRRTLKTIPNSPGVYRMLADDGTVLYVGKAKSLSKRVTSYTRGQGHTSRILRMINETASMEIITTTSETEALLLEANLIKKLKPRYNIILRDDKSFPHILVARDHDYPQILKHRGARKRKGQYYGPFASAQSVNRTLNTLQKAFLLRSCSDNVFDSRTRPCLLYQIKRCSAPCVDLIDQDSYGDLVGQADDFLRGRSSRILSDLQNQMEKAAEDQEFERAAGLRDRIRALTFIGTHQDINPQTLKEADVVAAYQAGGQTCIQVFFFRNGQNWGNRAYYPRNEGKSDASVVLEAFLAQFYDDKLPPKQVVINMPIEGDALLAEALTLKAGHKVEVLHPRRGEKKALTDHAERNAQEALGRKMSESASQRRLLDGVGEALGLETPPDRIEVYDNSHISGTNQIGAMIVAGPNGFEKNQYRKFNIKTENLAPGDDYAMMREVLTRRFTRLIKENGKRDDQDDAEKPADEISPWPDLVLIDGGAGQLKVVQEVFDDLGIDDVALCSIAKGPDRNAGRERFFMTGREPFSLPMKDPVLYFLQRLRDESHRMAIGTHRAKRNKQTMTNPLDRLQGIGPKRKKALLLHFGSARAVSRAGVQDLAKVSGMARYNSFMNLPNLLTLFRIVIVPAIVGVYFMDGDLKHWLALGLFIAAGITDFFDGYLARAMDATTKLGQLLDPIADKLLVAAALLILVWDGTIDGLSVLAATIILAREILVSGLREFLAGAQVSVPVTTLAKWKTTAQMVAIGFLLAGPAADKVVPYVTQFGLGLLWLAAVLTLYTGYDYLMKGLPHMAEED